MLRNIPVPEVAVRKDKPAAEASEAHADRCWRYYLPWLDCMVQPLMMMRAIVAALAVAASAWCPFVASFELVVSRHPPISKEIGKGENLFEEIRKKN